MPTVLSGGIVADPGTGSVSQRDLVVDDDGRVGGAEGAPVRVDVSGCVVMPGNVCAHHHLYSALARGLRAELGPLRNFPEILTNLWWRLDAALDEETVYLSALLGAFEAARSGTTTIIDHHASPGAIEGSLDRVAEGLDEVGLRGILCYEATDRHGLGDGLRGVRENVRFARDNSAPLIRSAMGLHASFTVGPATMAAAVEAARAEDIPLHIHLAEDPCDEDDSLREYGTRTLFRLRDEGALAPGDLFAHGVHLDDDERALLRDSGAWLLHNPRSNMNNRVGYAPVMSMGDRVALGTDGIDGDMFVELRACYLKAREHSLDSGPEEAFRRLSAGARLAGAFFGEEAFGGLGPGAPADLIVLDYEPPTPLGEDNFAGHLVFGISGARVRDVMVAGEWVVRDRRHVSIDEGELSARTREAAARLWRKM